MVVLGVNSEDFVGDARRFIERYGVTYPNVRDGARTTRDRFGIPFMPETMFLDDQGRIVAYVQGQVDAKTVDDYIELALGA